MSFFTDFIEQRLTSRKNVICLVVGETGIGKSWLSLRICEVVDSTFDVDRVVFDAKDFFEVLPKVPSGGFVLFDEAGLVAPAREFMDERNRILGYTMESFRFKLVNLFMCLPLVWMVDKIPRGLAHLLVVVEDRGYGKVYLSKPSHFERERIRTPYIGDIFTRKPAKELVEAYEDKRARVQEGRYQEYYQTLVKKEQDKRTMDDLLKEARGCAPKLRYKKGALKGKFNVHRIMRVLKVSSWRARELKGLLDLEMGPKPAYLVKKRDREGLHPKPTMKGL